ncbi:LuxR C-terminal-related transcriptional regulator [Streptomyces sp. NPDC004111]|uniref:LuxR C-terminal-related transcriptional regulator n=1 Tax=Streptomyces sp. NPDC004111 TaxID=3364690 RepID=UPI0036A5AA9E
MIRVQVTCSAGLFSSALAALLRTEGGFDVTCSPADTRASGTCPSHVRVSDAEELAPLPGGGRPAVDTSDGTRLLVLAAAHRPGVLRRAFEAGALGYVDRQGPPSSLVEGIRTVARGERYVDVSLAVGLLHATEVPLTPRELSVLSIAAQGACVTEIAHVLHLSRGTVRNYLAAAVRKVGARNRVDAIRIARSAGWM